MLLWALLVIFAPASEQADWLTLMVPSSVFEGDNIFLKCKGKDESKIKTMTYYKNGIKVFSSKHVSNFPIYSAALSNSGNYYCSATLTTRWSNKHTSKTVEIKVQELFPRPVLTASSSLPLEGTPVTLTCKTQLLPQKLHVQLRFCIFRNHQTLGSGWSSSAELQIPAVWSEDSGSYMCEAETVTPRIRKQSLQSQIHVQRIPVSNVSLEIQATGGRVIEGGKLVLLCAVAKGTGNITFSWHREDPETSLGRKTQRSMSAELEIPSVKGRDSGEYYCRASNGHGAIQSKVVNILVHIPVSRPLFTLRAPGAQAMVGDVVELHCEALRGSPPILYRFYHENITLGNSSAPSGGGGAAFNLSLTPQHSGNYSCEADNGLGAQRSEVVSLSISGPGGYGGKLLAVRVAGGLFGALGFAVVALLFYSCSHKISGESSAIEAFRGASSSNPEEGTPPSPLLALEEQQPVYVNVHSVDVDVIYSQVCSIQQPHSPANIRRALLENKDSQVIYSSVKKS